MQINTSQAILLGYSGHAYVVAEAAIKSGLALLGYTEIQKKAKDPFHLRFLGDETLDNFKYWDTCSYYILGVGSNIIREHMAALVKSKGAQCIAVIHPNSSVSDDIKVGAGTFIARNVAVNPLVEIGENVILNTACSIDHECKIGNNVHIAPGAVLAGQVHVNNGAFIGANSVIKEGITIGENSIIGAGSVILNDIEANITVVGNPSKRIY